MTDTTSDVDPVTDRKPLERRPRGSSVPPASSDRSVEHRSRSLFRSVVAVGLGCSGSVMAVWHHSAYLQRGALALVATAALWQMALRMRPVGIVRAAAMAAVSLSAALIVPGVQLGRVYVLVAFASVTVADAALVEWRPVRRWPSRPWATAGLALIPLVAAQVVWWQLLDARLTLLLVATALVVVELYHRRPGMITPADRALRLPVTRGIDVARRVTGWSDIVAYVQRGGHRLGAWLSAPKTRSDRSFVAAITAGFVLRLAWALLMTNDYTHWYTAWNLRIAEQFSRGDTPGLSGIHTAYWPPGYGLALAPVSWFSQQVSWISIVDAASLLNVLFGTATILLVGALAREWLSPLARNPAAWLIAIAPSHIYATSVAEAETFATMLWVGVVWGATVIVRRRAPSARAGPLFALGLVVGLATLTKDLAIVLTVFPALVVRASSGSWKGALRATVPVLIGASALLVPWAVRNAVQVDHYSPFATVGSEGLCATKYDMDRNEYFARGGGALGMDREELVDCYRDSPFDNRRGEITVEMPDDWKWGHPDEGAWARRNTSGFVAWAVRNPLHFVEGAPEVAYGVAGSDSNGGYEMATKHTEGPAPGLFTAATYVTAANAWYYAVVALALLALARIPTARRAIPVWVAVVVLTSYTLVAPWAQSRHAFSAYPFLAILAGGAVAAVIAVTAQPQLAGDPVAGSDGDDA